MQKFFEKKYVHFFNVCCFLFIIFLILINLYNPSSFKILGTVLAIIGLILLKKFKINNKYLFIILLIIPFIIRFSLLFLDYGSLVSDYEWFYNNAVAFSKGMSLDKNYIALFPYLHLYVIVLGTFFKILGSQYSVVVFTNLLLELIGIFFLYQTVKNKSYSKKLLFLYLYNPFSILWIPMCHSVIAVNTFLIIVFYFFLKIDFSKKYILYSLLTGIFMGIANNFRPVLIIFVIAIAIYYINLIFRKYKWQKLFLSFILITLSFISVNKVLLLTTEYNIDTKIKRSQSGWSIFVGSNINSKGLWNEEDSKYFIQLASQYDVTTAHTLVKNEALKRYKSYGLKNIPFMISKAKILGSNLPEYTSQSFFEFVLHKFSIIEYVFKIYLFCYLLLIFLLNLFNLYKKMKLKVLMSKYDVLIIFALGLFLAGLLVEVHARYFLPILLPLIYTAVTRTIDNSQNTKNKI